MQVVAGEEAHERVDALETALVVSHLAHPVLEREACQEGQVPGAQASERLERETGVGASATRRPGVLIEGLDRMRAQVERRRDGLAEPEAEPELGVDEVGEDGAGRPLPRRMARRPAVVAQGLGEIGESERRGGEDVDRIEVTQSAQDAAQVRVHAGHATNAARGLAWAMPHTSDIPEIDPREAEARIAEGAYHVDVRESDEVRAKRIPGAATLPLSQFMDRYEEALPKETPIVVSCRSGARSGRVTAFLLEQGYDAVNLAGGLLAWEEDGLPVEQG